MALIDGVSLIEALFKRFDAALIETGILTLEGYPTLPLGIAN